MFSSKMFTVVCLAIAMSGVFAAPSDSANLQNSVLRVRQLNGRDLTTYHPEPSFEIYDEPQDHDLSKRGDFTLEGASIGFTAKQLGVDEKDINYKSGFSGDLVQHAYIKQSHDGIDVINTAANVVFDNDNKVVSFGSTMSKITSYADSEPTIAADDAVRTAEEKLGGKHTDVDEPILSYLVLPDGKAALVYVVQIENMDNGIFVEAYVDAHSGELLSVTDYGADASYLALPLQKQYPSQGLEVITNPLDTFASPRGWHSDGTTNFRTTSGNNVLSYKGDVGNVTRESSAVLNFNYPPDFKFDPSVTKNVNAARVNTFYVVNSVHDLAYRYGFTERAYNFQKNNFGKGGKGNDRVLVSVQDSKGINNAQFFTPPDGQNGRMRMFIFNLATPRRDGSMENDIVVHEMAHGITNRMTGGGTGRCLQTLEAGGLGEGWSDSLAEWTEQTSRVIRDYKLGQFVINRAGGIRTYPYSTNPKTNPLRYSSLKKFDEVHDIGEVWANMLHNVYAALVNAKGWSSTARRNPQGKEGNIVFLHLFMDALSLQPCNPTFVAARSAWIQADRLRYGGANKCLLWKAFASRGLGVKAAKYKDDFSVPSGC